MYVFVSFSTGFGARAKKKRGRESRAGKRQRKKGKTAATWHKTKHHLPKTTKNKAVGAQNLAKWQLETQSHLGVKLWHAATALRISTRRAAMPEASVPEGCSCRFYQSCVSSLLLMRTSASPSSLVTAVQAASCMTLGTLQTLCNGRGGSTRRS